MRWRMTIVPRQERVGPPPPRTRPRTGGFFRSRLFVGGLAILAGFWVVRYAQRNDVAADVKGWLRQAGVSIPNMAGLRNMIASYTQPQPTEVAAPENSPEVASQAPEEGPEPPAANPPPREMGQDEMASLERIEGDERIRVVEDSPVYQYPDVSSAVVGAVHRDRLMLVTGTTVSFLQVYLTKTDVQGYVPMDVGNVLTSPRGGICYALAAGTRLYQAPNRSSQIVDEVGPESEIMSQADAIGGYALVKTVHGRRGFVTGAAIGLSVVCAEAFESE
jgi:hypothetical protein